MLFLTMICHQDLNTAKKTTIAEAFGLQDAFSRFVSQIFDSIGLKGGKLSKETLENKMKTLTPPKDWSTWVKMQLTYKQ